MNRSLENKIALVTGGTTGIGLATVRKLAAAGARVIATGRQADTLAAARSELGHVAEVIQSDAGNPAAVAALFAHVRQRYGRLDILFLNAGIARFGSLEEVVDEAFVEELFATNVKGPLLAVKHALPLLAPGASVVFNTSALQRKGWPGTSVYAATKAALRAAARSLAAELAPRGVRVNAVSPGPVETPIYGKLGLPQAAVDELAQSVLESVPLGRFGRAEEVADAVLFLASSQSSFVAGTELSVDGGFAEV